MSDLVRRVEKEIDEEIRALPLWRCAREDTVRSILDCYRESAEAILVAMSWATSEGPSEAAKQFEKIFLVENRMRAGIFYALKWALTLCPDESAEVSDEKMVQAAYEVGTNYEALVDALKLAMRGLVQIEVDREARQITVYEGGDVTGEDWALVEQQWRSNPIRSHIALTEDADQLTAAWTAGDYRGTAAWLCELALTKLLEQPEVMFAPPGVEPVPLFRRPAVLVIPDPPDPGMKAVLDDLTLTPDKLTGQGFWRYSSFTDTPIVLAGTERVSPSGALVALGGPTRDDAMLRLAALVDAAQYVQVSGLREERMITVCRRVLEPLKWTVTPRLRLNDPPGDVDVYAIRERERMVIQLKSTLRPTSPSEVDNRNTDILNGIEQANRARVQLGEDVTAVVITDGYRGDYATWQVALERRIAIGTLEDLDAIGHEPAGAFEILQKRVGFGGEHSSGSPRERVGDLVGWKLRLVDTRAD